MLYSTVTSISSYVPKFQSKMLFQEGNFSKYFSESIIYPQIPQQTMHCLCATVYTPWAVLLLTLQELKSPIKAVDHNVVRY